MIINNVNGFIVEEKNVEQLYQAIKYILFNKDRMIKMGKQSRKIFENKNNYSKFYEMLDKSLKYLNEQ